MKKAPKICLYIFFLSLFISLPTVTPLALAAEGRIEITPSISIREVYDDNIYLDPTDEKSDYTTEISPRINLDLLSEKSNLMFDYTPTLVFYAEESDNNTVRHSGTVTYNRDLTEHFDFHLSDTYFSTEEPIENREEAEESIEDRERAGRVEGVRNTERNTYQRNSFRTSLGYQFGPEDTWTVGYNNSFYANEDGSFDDGAIQSPFTKLAYWFNERQGIELNYEFTNADFWRDDNSDAQDDYTGHGTGARYIHRFTPHTSGSVDLNYTTRDFEGDSEDYNVIDSSLGFDHAFSPDLSLSAGIGFFIQQRENSGDTMGPSFNVSLVKKLEKGSFSIGGRSGWDEEYLDVEETGFSQYYAFDTKLQHQLLEKVNTYVGALYRLDKFVDGDEESSSLGGNFGLTWDLMRSLSLSMGYTIRHDTDTYESESLYWRGNFGLRWAFLDLFSLSLDYFYTQRNDDVDTDEYKVNRVMLTLTTSKLWRW